MPKDPPARPTEVDIELNLGFLRVSSKWEPDPTERRAAWQLLVELTTRVAFQPLGADEGSAREALSSLHSLFAITREVLKSAGPSVGVHDASVGHVALLVLNRGLRPFLSRWHPQLHAWEGECPADRSAVAHERQWPSASEFRGELALLQDQLRKYAGALATIAGVASVGA